MGDDIFQQTLISARTLNELVRGSKDNTMLEAKLTSAMLRNAFTSTDSEALNTFNWFNIQWIKWIFESILYRNKYIKDLHVLNSRSTVPKCEWSNFALQFSVII